jgi:cytosine permease
MAVDYLLSANKWSGPRAGFNPAGWIAWAVGFLVGILPNTLLPESVRVGVPCAPVAAFIVGAVVYFVLVKAGVQSGLVPMPAKAAEAK